MAAALDLLRRFALNPIRTARPEPRQGPATPCIPAQRAPPSVLPPQKAELPQVWQDHVVQLPAVLQKNVFDCQCAYDGVNDVLVINYKMWSCDVEGTGSTAFAGFTGTTSTLTEGPFYAWTYSDGFCSRYNQIWLSL